MSPPLPLKMLRANVGGAMPGGQLAICFGRIFALIVCDLSDPVDRSFEVNRANFTHT